MEYVVYPTTVCVVLLVVATFTGMWITGENPYRSYALQACAWLEGRLDLGMDYPWLELAIFEGKYYVSFPPFPSFVLLPFAVVCGADTPDHALSVLFTVVGVVYALRLYKMKTGGFDHAGQYVLFLFLGNGYLFIAMQGWVWFLAQCMCFTMSLMALYYAERGRGGGSLACWACAVGCRPMVVVYFPLLLLILLRHGREQTGMRAITLIRSKWYWAVPAFCIVSVYMILNVARFGNPLEFGHSYLPEFMRVEEGQFSLSYLRKNLSQLLRLPQMGGEHGALMYDTYDCMAFWLIAPIFILFFFVWAYGLCCKRGLYGAEIAVIPLTLLAHLLIVCCHRTLGGYQFGNRYLVDMLPYVFYGVLLLKPGSERFSLWSMPLCAMGFSINLIGTVATYNHWI